MAMLKALFSGPSTPTPAKTPPPPDRSSDETASRIAAQRERFFGAGEGRSSEVFGAADKPSAVVRLLGDTGA